MNDAFDWPWQSARRAALRRKLAAPFTPLTPVIPPSAADPRAEKLGMTPQERARAWLSSPASAARVWLPPHARADASPFRRSSALPAVLAASASDASPPDDEPQAPVRPFGWVGSSAPMVPVIPTVLWHVPRPIRPSFDLNEAMNNCLVRGAVSFVVGGLLGAAMGVFIGSWQLSGHTPEAGLSDPRNLTARQALREMVQLMKSKSVSWAKNFAVVGSIYSTVECFLASGRGRHDIKNPVLAGCITGGALAYAQGPVAILGGCAGFAAFSLVIEQFMHSGGSPFSMGPEEDEDVGASR